jgi:hypothetical protein
MMHWGNFKYFLNKLQKKKSKNHLHVKVIFGGKKVVLFF